MGSISSGWLPTRASAVLAVLAATDDLTWAQVKDFTEGNNLDWTPHVDPDEVSPLVAQDGEVYIPDGLEIPSNWLSLYTTWKNGGDIGARLPSPPSASVPPALPQSNSFPDSSPSQYEWPDPGAPPPAAAPQPSYISSQPAPAPTSPAAAAAAAAAQATPAIYNAPGVKPTPNAVAAPGTIFGLPVWMVLAGGALILYMVMKKKKR